MSADPKPDAGAEVPAVLPVVPRETYAVEAEVARGGIGRVLRAQHRAMDRTVAIKEMLRDNPETARRFIREALLTGRLEHPSIVPVHEAGRWPTGEPFYSMKLVSGRTLLEAIQTSTSLRERFALLPHVLAVAEAIAYAHSKHVIHRDIKPSNVILGQFGETVVIDWGLAKDLRQEDDPAIVGAPSSIEPAASAHSTIMGSIMGTPAYMAPEQAKGEVVDERADVYALGALLYHVLSASSPYTPKDSQAVLESQTATVSADSDVTAATRDVLAEIIKGTVLPLEERQADLPQDLLAIVKKAMAHDAAQRYPTAKELAEDLRRYQNGQLVSAHQYSMKALLGRWLRKNRAAAMVGAAALAVLAAGGTVAIARIVHAREVAETERAEAQHERHLAIAAREQAEARANELILLQARASLTRDPTSSLAWLKQYPPLAPGWAEARQIAADARSRGVARHVLRAGRGALGAFSFSLDGTRLVSTGEDHVIRVWDVATGQGREVARSARPLGIVMFSNDGREILSDGEGRMIERWQVATGERSLLAAHDAELYSITPSPDGKILATHGADHKIRLYPMAGGAPEVIDLPEVAHPLNLFYTPAKKLVGLTVHDGLVELWDIESKTARTLKTPEHLVSAELSPDGKKVTSFGETTIRLWTLDPEQVVTYTHPYVLDAQLTSDEKTMVSVGMDGAVRVWDLTSGKARVLYGHDGAVQLLALSPDGTLAVSGGKDGSLRVWPLRESEARILRGLDKGAQRPQFAPDGKHVAAAGTDGDIRIWDVATGASSVLKGHLARTSFVAYAPDGTHLASVSEDKTVRLWDLQAGTEQVLATMTSAAPLRLRYAPDGKSLLYTEGGETLWVYDLVARAPRCSFKGQAIDAALFVPDGQHMAFGNGNEVRLGDVATCDSRVLYQHDGAVVWLAASLDGTLLASASRDKTGAVWSQEGGVRRLKGHELELYAVALSPDGKLAATSGYDQTIRLWSTATGENVKILRGHEQATGLVLFAPDGKTLISSSLDQTVRLWAVPSGESRVLRGHEGMIWGLAVSPDSSLAASASRDGTVRLWPVDVSGGMPSEPTRLLDWLGATTTARVGAGNRVASP